MLHAVRNALRPGYARVIGRKAVARLSPHERSSAEAGEWARSVRVLAQDACPAIDAALWKEAVDFREQAKQRADAVSAELGRDVGFGARVDLLYFVTRLVQPEIAVETGVAFGYSSYAVLSAMARNGRGRLYSSDFPFFRERDPERLIGAMVPAELKDRWTLLTRGDDENLPIILDSIGDGRIDFLHYDSDKSYAGRVRAMALLEPRLAADAVVVMDDIEDNTYFRDHVQARAGIDYTVFGPGPHFVGATGLHRT